MGRRTARTGKARAVDLPCSTSDAGGGIRGGKWGTVKLTGPGIPLRGGLQSMEAGDATLPAIESTASKLVSLGHLGPERVPVLETRAGVGGGRSGPVVHG